MTICLPSKAPMQLKLFHLSLKSVLNVHVVLLLFVLLHNQFISNYLYMYCIVILNFEPQGMYLLKWRSTQQKLQLYCA